MTHASATAQAVPDTAGPGWLQATCVVSQIAHVTRTMTDAHAPNLTGHVGGQGRVTGSSLALQQSTFLTFLIPALRPIQWMMPWFHVDGQGQSGAAFTPLTHHADSSC